MRNVFLIARNTFMEAVRQRLVLLITLAALALILLSKYLLRLDLGHGVLKFVSDFTGGALTFFGMVISVVAVCQLTHSELERKTVATLLSKPVNFLQFTYGKTLGVAAMLFCFCFAVGLSGWIMVEYTEFSLSKVPPEFLSDKPFSSAGFWVFVLCQWLKLCLIAAMACAVCSVSSSLMFSVTTSFMLVAAGILASIDTGPLADKNIAQIVATVLLPNFNFFSESEKYAFSAPSCIQTSAAAAYAAGYFVIAGAAAAWCFSRRSL